MGHEFTEYLTVNELAFVTGRRRCVIERLVWLELIEPTRVEPEPCFAPDIVPRVRRLIRLHDQLGISWTSMGLVLELMDRVNSDESRLSNYTD